MKTADELFEYFLDEIPELTKEEFEDFMIEVLEKHKKSQQSTTSLNDNDLENVAGGLNWGTKLASAGLAAMTLFSSGVGATYKKSDDIDPQSGNAVVQSISSDKKSVASEKFAKVNTWCKDNPRIIVGASLGASVLMTAATGIKLAVPSIKESMLHLKQTMSERKKVRAQARTQARLNRQLFSAINKHDPKKVESLIKQGADVNAIDRNGYSALASAVREYRYAVEYQFNTAGGVKWRNAIQSCYLIVNTLIESGAAVKDAKLPDGKPIIALLQYKFADDALKLLLKKGAVLYNASQYGKELKHVCNYAAARGDADFFRLLINQGAPLDKKVLDCAVRGNNAYIVKELLIRGVRSNRALNLKTAINNGNVDIVKELIAYENDGKTDIYDLNYAWDGRQGVVLDELLKHIDPKNSGAGQFLIKVAESDDLSTVIKLLDLGFDVNYKRAYDGKTALFFCNSSKIPLLRTLLNYGADVNVRNRNGATPLMSVIKNSTVDCYDAVKLLLKRGADVNISDDEGNSALSLAIKNNAIGNDTIQLLLDKGNISVDNLKKVANEARKNGELIKADLIMRSFEKNI